jgi:hypothetical protein
MSAAIDPPSYLQPYINAAKRHGAGFGTLLWASPKTQAARFAALLRGVNVDGQKLLDVGCGRADFLEFIEKMGLQPTMYVGLEALEELAAAAEAKHLHNCSIIRGDFVRDPSLLDVGADILFFCGSLNTLDDQQFHRAITAGFAAAAHSLVFNFLSSPKLAASEYLYWRRMESVLTMTRRLSDNVRVWQDYLDGDATIAISKGTA